MMTIIYKPKIVSMLISNMKTQITKTFFAVISIFDSLSESKKFYFYERKVFMSISSYQGYVSRTAAAETKVATVMPILAAACHPVTYSFVINDEIGQTLYRKPNGDWSLNSEDDSVANIHMFTIETKTGEIETGCAATGKIKTATDFNQLTLPNSLPPFTIQATCTAHPEQYDRANVVVTVWQWIINRNGGSTASATTNGIGCTIAELAKIIELERDEYKEWLTFHPGEVTVILPNGTTSTRTFDSLQVNDVLGASQEFMIPNTILSIFVDTQYRLTTQWREPYNSNLKELGFFVSKFNNENQEQGNAQLDNAQAIKAMNIIIHLFDSHLSNKKLHGVLIASHGSEEKFGVGKNYFEDMLYNPWPGNKPPTDLYLGPPTQVGYSDVLLKQKYKLAAVLPFACFAYNPNTRKMGNIMWGNDESFRKTMGMHEFPQDDIKYLWTGGRQATIWPQ